METNKAIKAFCEKKATAETMRMIFGITAILYIGFIIWTICIKNWSSLWWEFNVWLLLVALAFGKNGEIIDAELAIAAIELEESKVEFAISVYKVQWIPASFALPAHHKPIIFKCGDKAYGGWYDENLQEFQTKDPKGYDWSMHDVECWYYQEKVVEKLPS